MTQIRGNRPRKDDARGESAGRCAQERGRDMQARPVRSREGSAPASSRAASRATRARGSSSCTEDPASGNRRARRSDAPSSSRASGVRSGADNTGRPRSTSAQRRAGKGPTGSGGRVCTRCGCFGRRTRRRSYRRSHRDFAARFRVRYRLCCTSGCELMSAQSRVFRLPGPRSRGGRRRRRRRGPQRLYYARGRQHR